MAAVLTATGGDVEFGAGSGRLALDILLALEARGQLPAHYWILEVSPDLAERQRTLAAGAPPLLARVGWLSALPQGFRGVMLGNEVLDAMPVQAVALAGRRLAGARRGL